MLYHGVKKLRGVTFLNTAIQKLVSQIFLIIKSFNCQAAIGKSKNI